MDAAQTRARRRREEPRVPRLDPGRSAASAQKPVRALGAYKCAVARTVGTLIMTRTRVCVCNTDVLPRGVAQVRVRARPTSVRGRRAHHRRRRLARVAHPHPAEAQVPHRPRAVQGSLRTCTPSNARRRSSACQWPHAIAAANDVYTVAAPHLRRRLAWASRLPTTSWTRTPCSTRASPRGAACGCCRTLSGG